RGQHHRTRRGVFVDSSAPCPRPTRNSRGASSFTSPHDTTFNGSTQERGTARTSKRPTAKSRIEVIRGLMATAYQHSVAGAWSARGFSVESAWLVRYIWASE